MKLRLAVTALTALAFAAGAPALALAQGGSTVASTPVPNPPAKTSHKAAHHTKKAAHHHKAAPAPAAK